MVKVLIKYGAILATLFVLVSLSLPAVANQPANINGSGSWYPGFEDPVIKLVKEYKNQGMTNYAMQLLRF